MSPGDIAFGASIEILNTWRLKGIPQPPSLLVGRAQASYAGDWEFHSQSVVCLLFYGITTVFQFHHGGDMIYEMRRKPQATLIPTKVIFNLPRDIGIV